MKTYETPIVNLLYVENEDILTNSIEGGECDFFGEDIFFEG